MTSDDDDSDSVPYPSKKLVRAQQHRRLVSSSSLPSYPRSRHGASASLSTLGSVAEDTPPPRYTTDASSNPFIAPSETVTSADEADAESEPPNIGPSGSSLNARLLVRGGDARRRASLHHRRSLSGRVYPLPPISAGYREDSDSRTDAILERSVHALEVSNALLQSSISTRASLSTAFQSPEEPHNPYSFRIDSISRRFAASDVVDTQMDELLASTEDFSAVGPSGPVSQSAPPLSTLHRHMASNSMTSTNSSSRRSGHSSRAHSYSRHGSGHSTPKSPSPTRTSQQHLSPLPSSHSHEYSNSQLPHTPTTPAYNLLSSIVMRSPPEARRRPGRGGIRGGTPSMPDLHKASSSSSPVPRASRIHGSASSSMLRPTHHLPIRRASSFDSIRPAVERERRAGRKQAPYPKTALVPVISPRFFQRYVSPTKRRSGSPVDPKSPIAAETVARLRRILLEDSSRASSSSARGRGERRRVDEEPPGPPRMRPVVGEIFVTPPSNSNSPISAHASPLTSPSPSPLRRELRLSRDKLSDAPGSGPSSSAQAARGRGRATPTPIVRPPRPRTAVATSTPPSSFVTSRFRFARRDGL